MKKFLVVSFVGSLLVAGLWLPALSHAQVFSSQTAQMSAILESLQKQVNAIQTQLQELLQKQAATRAVPATPAMPGVSRAIPAVPAIPPTTVAPSGFVTLEEIGESVRVPCELPTLQIGTRNNSVYLVQMFLKKAGYYPEGLITGYFGNLTSKAVQNFQKAKGLTTSGQLDSATAKSLNAEVRKHYSECGVSEPVPAPELGTGWSIYRYQKYGFEFKYPSKYFVLEFPTVNRIEISKDRSGVGMGYHPASISVEENLRQLSLEEWLKAHESGFTNPNSSIIDLHERKTSLGRALLFTVAPVNARYALISWLGFIIKIYAGDENNVFENILGSISPMLVTSPSITVLSPNGGERWRQGETNQIRWNATKGGYAVYLGVLNSQNVDIYTIASRLDNSGSYNWTIPTDFKEGQYRIYASLSAAGQVSDTSDAPFSIVSATIRPVLTPMAE